MKLIPRLAGACLFVALWGPVISAGQATAALAGTVMTETGLAPSGAVVTVVGQRPD